MAVFDPTVLIDALRETEVFSDEQIELAEAAGDDLQAWTVERFMEIDFPRAEAMVAYRTVRTAVEQYAVTEEVKLTIPEEPSYLSDTGKVPVFGKTHEDGTLTVESDGTKGDYDPSDPTQFVTVGDQMFRWDGKRSARFPKGERHEVVIMPHKLVNGVHIPDAAQATAAKLAGHEWFHKGYDCWITGDGKPYGIVPRETLDAMRRNVARGVPQQVA